MDLVFVYDFFFSLFCQERNLEIFFSSFGYRIWIILNHFWIILNHFDSFWFILIHFESFLNPFWIILSHFWIIFQESQRKTFLFCFSIFFSLLLRRCNFAHLFLDFLKRFLFAVAIPVCWFFPPWWSRNVRWFFLLPIFQLFFFTRATAFSLRPQTPRKNYCPWLCWSTCWPSSGSCVSP